MITTKRRNINGCAFLTSTLNQLWVKPIQKSDGKIRQTFVEIFFAPVSPFTIGVATRSNSGYKIK